MLFTSHRNCVLAVFHRREAAEPIELLGAADSSASRRICCVVDVTVESCAACSSYTATQLRRASRSAFPLCSDLSRQGRMASVSKT